LEVWGTRVVSSYSGPGLGWTPAANDFFRIQSTDKIRANFWPPMHKHTATEIDKSGQIRDTKPKTGEMDVPGEL